MRSVDIEAKTTEEAITLACEQLAATRDQLKIEIIDLGPGMLMSLFSNKKARIRATLVSGAPAAAARGDAEELRSILENIAAKIQSGATVAYETADDEILYTIQGNGSGIFIGKHGQTLEALQYLANKIRLSRFRGLPHIQVDCESYRARHLESMVELANRLREKAKKRGAPVTTNPLNPADRRIIHMTLKEDSELTTWSKGSGTLKKVIIAPRQPERS